MGTSLLCAYPRFKISRWVGWTLTINQHTATIGTGTAHGGTWRVPFNMRRHVLDI
jgi:hypothetical protein